MQRLHLALQFQATGTEGFAHGPGQSRGQGVEALAQQAEGAPRVLGRQARLQAGQALAALAHLAVERALQAHLQVIQALGLLAQPFARVAQASGQPVQAQVLVGDQLAHAQQQAALQALQALAQAAGIRCQQLGGRGGRRRANVGDEVADGHIRLVADGADDGGLAGGDGAGHGLFVEAPEVFEGAAAPGQDERVEALGIRQGQGADDLRGGLAALHGGGHQGQADLGRTAAEHADDVADHRAGGGGDDAYALRMGRQRALALGGEQALAGELLLERFEGQAQGAVTGGLHGVGDHLVVATAFEQRDLAPHLHRQPVTQGLAHLEALCRNSAQRTWAWLSLRVK